ncbi:MAG: hypothetical protein ACREJT_16800, partial [Myxococcota bacterium]
MASLLYDGEVDQLISEGFSPRDVLGLESYLPESRPTPTTLGGLASIAGKGAASGFAGQLASGMA